MAAGIHQSRWNFYDSLVSDVGHAEVELSQLYCLPLGLFQQPRVELGDATQDPRQKKATCAGDPTSWDTDGK